MKVQVTRRVAHGYFLLDEKGQKVVETDADGNKTVATGTIRLEPGDTIYDTTKEPLAGKFSASEIDALVASGAFRVLPEAAPAEPEQPKPGEKEPAAAGKKGPAKAGSEL